ncbi:alpha/beta hydrolase family protein [Stutzerimonas nosocomialis]|uniref:alpha/beta hydrolase family protein n=1 Tax=Stutzerimonas nosocomialis TaxID=1056496 RepID=UPI0019D678DF|nr:alpha/beta hydrolase [Stutzerimonas nosocomialis]
MSQLNEHSNASPSRAELIAGLVSAMVNPLRSPIIRNPADDGLEYSDIYFPAIDGVRLDGWFIPGDSDKLIIANHPIWANRYGFPGHIAPYGDAWAASGNNIEVNFMPDYKHLHDAGYNVLAYDLRNFGHSASGGGGAIGNGIREYRDVIGSLRYARSRSDLRDMKIGLLSRCCGMNATMVGMTKHPGDFEGVRAIVAPQPISLSSFYRTLLGHMGMPDALPEVAEALRRVTSMDLKDMDMPQYAAAVDIPTLLLQVREDRLTTPADVQAIFDAIPAEKKELIWIEGTHRRFDGYNYLPNNPKPMLDWFERFMA